MVRPAHSVMGGRLVVLIALLSCAPMATAGPTPVTLYAHLINVQDFPLNTQLPDAAYEENVSFGAGATQLTCLHETVGDVLGGVTSQSFYTYYGYVAPAVVEYAWAARGETPRTHPVRGVTADVHLNESQPMSLVWYLSMSTAANVNDLLSQENHPTPLPIPNVVIRATLRSGDAVSIDDRAYNDGLLLARGATDPVTLVADQVNPASSQVKALGLVDGRWLYEFTLPLGIEVPSIRKTDGANLRVDVYMDNPQCDPDDGSIQTTVFMHSSDGRRPRLEFAIDNPFEVTSTSAQWVKDDLVLTFEASSVWGLYDLNEETLELKVSGPSPGNFERLVLPTYHHHPHSDPTPQLIWVWKNATQAPVGHYDVSLTGANLQQTATLEAHASFDKASGRQAVGSPAGFAVLALVAVALLKPRRLRNDSANRF